MKMGKPDPNLGPNLGPVLVTGAAGFIGSHVVDRLLASGVCVVGLDNFDPYYDVRLKRANAEACVRAGAFVEGDIRDGGAMRALFERVRPRSVIHLAGRAGVRPSIADPAGYMHTNVVGTMNLLSAASAVGCARFVAASSSSVYGNAERVPFSEEQDVSRPISPYAASKRSMELACHAQHHLTGMPIACLRFFTVFGARQRPDLAISLFLERVSRGEAIPFFGDGSASRDYTYIDDIVGGVLAAHDRIDSHGYRVWNLGGSEPHTLTELVATIERVVGKRAVLDRKPTQAGDVERTFADLTRSARELAFRPTTRLEAGIVRQWAWMRERAATAKI